MTIFPTKKKEVIRHSEATVGYVEQVLSLGIGSTTDELTASLPCKRLRRQTSYSGQATGTGAAAETEESRGECWGATGTTCRPPVHFEMIQFNLFDASCAFCGRQSGHTFACHSVFRS